MINIAVYPSEVDPPVIHDPFTGTTPSQRLAAADRRKRMERFVMAAAPKPIKPPGSAPGGDPMPASAYSERGCFRGPESETPQPIIRVETILRAVIAFYPKISVNDLKSIRRTDNVVRPRQIAMYLAKELTTCSLPEIGRRIGDRDHTTVLHSVRKIRSLIATDLALANMVAKIRASLEAGT